MPILLQTVAGEADRGDALSALLGLVEAVLRRTSYLVLFIENPMAIHRLVVVAKASQWVMQQLVQRPVLLDELISAEGLGRVPEERELRELLRQQSLRLNVDDVEGHMEMLRYFRLAHHLHIVAAEASGKLPLMKVSDYLSFLADALLDYVLEISWLQLVEKHGYPMHNGELASKPDFAIIAYGKLGGLELSHSSDLDLVFLYEADDGGVTYGGKPLDNHVFFTRLGQRIIHMLTTLTTLGRLYEVDMRLRPSGANGLLVSTIEAFEKYQKESAWTWEHQALVRGRPITGSPALIAEFQRIRQQTLNKQRDIEHLRKEVVDMRTKMYDNLTPASAKGENATVFHLKHSRGGIVDIEFMVQFSVLAWGCQNADIARYTDNIRILEALAKAGLFTAEDAQTLMDAYRAYRSEGHKLALLQAKNEVPVQQFAKERAAVERIWANLFAPQ
jgi:glutamate-ammonia-ligase adenylyltransferase